MPTLGGLRGATPPPAEAPFCAWNGAADKTIAKAQNATCFQLRIAAGL